MKLPSLLTVLAVFSLMCASSVASAQETTAPATSAAPCPAKNLPPPSVIRPAAPPAPVLVGSFPAPPPAREGHETRATPPVEVHGTDLGLTVTFHF